MAANSWDPAQYERFRQERSQPFYDLLALVRPRPGMRVVDLGCGTGDLTRVLHDKLEARETLGLDSSAAMLARAAPLAGHGLRFEPGDIQSFPVRRCFDLAFSNSALHWIPDHATLFARLIAALDAGGQLAVQMPAIYRHASHLAVGEVADEFAAPLGGYKHREYVLPPAAYQELLERWGSREAHVEERIYEHRLASREEVVEWVKGSLLTGYRERLPEETYQRFLARYRERLLPQLEDTRPYVYAYRRILLRARF
ncbi:MAG: methyltransferase domain-containing protein [Terriglobales bacterium]